MAVVSTITLPDERKFIIHDPNAITKSGGTFIGRVYGVGSPQSNSELVTKGYVDSVTVMKDVPITTQLLPSDYLFLERNGQIYKILASKINISGDDSQEDAYSITTENGDFLLTESGDRILFN